MEGRYYIATMIFSRTPTNSYAYLELSLGAMTIAIASGNMTWKKESEQEVVSTQFQTMASTQQGAKQFGNFSWLKQMAEGKKGGSHT